MAGVMNQALQDAAALRAMEANTVEVEDAKTVLDRQQAELDETVTYGDRKQARFDYEKAGAVAVGLGFVLNPVAGLLMGAAMGFAGKRHQQNINDALAEQENATTDAYLADLEQMQQALARAESPEDRAQVANQIKNLKTGYELFLNGQTEMGYDRIDKAVNDHSGYLVTNETQAIAQAGREEEARLALGQEQYDRYTMLGNKYDAETMPARDQYTRALFTRELLRRGKSADVLGVLASMPLIANPAAGDASDASIEFWSGVGNVFQRLESRVEKELLSGGMSEVSRRELDDLVATIIDATGAQMQNVQRRAQMDARTAGLPEQWVQERFNYTAEFPDMQMSDVFSQVEAEENTPDRETLPPRARNARGGRRPTN